MNDWKPGDVAMVTFDNALMVMRERGQADVVTMIALRREDDWGLASYGCSIDVVTDARPLMVIDPEDDEQRDSLIEAMAQASIWKTMPCGVADLRAYRSSQLQAALREFTKPTPPKLAEPTGLGAVVRDRKGLTWVRRHPEGAGWAWVNGYQNWAGWDDIDAIEVLSAGWSE